MCFQTGGKNSGSLVFSRWVVVKDARFTQQNQDALLQELNQFTRRTHTLDEVYLLDVLLCDNEVDRDFERFSDSALETLKTLFVGKDSVWNWLRGENEVSFFNTKVVSDLI